MLLEEMQGITSKLEVILDEKKELVNNLLNGLDQEIKKAQIALDKVKRLNAIPDSRVSEQLRINNGKKQVPIKTIKKLVKKGMSKQEIAKCLGLPAGEIDLILKLVPLTAEAGSSK